MKRARVTDIIAIASEISGVPVKSITGRSKLRKNVRIRQAVYYVARQHKHSFPRIGQYVCRDHSTVMSGIRTAEAVAERDMTFRALLAEIGYRAATEPMFGMPKAEVAPIDKPDEAHRFHAGIAAGSAKLAAMLRSAA